MPERLRTIGILGGSFNPVHIGHMMVASYVRQAAGLDEVWLSLSPANPLKPDAHPASDADRLAMLTMAVGDTAGLGVCDHELTLPRPSYTLRLLDTLAERYPDCHFKLITGSDNWLLFDRWRDPEAILDRYGLIVYPRPGYEVTEISDPRVTLVEAPTVNLSSTFLRDAISRGLDMNFFLPAGVYSYIINNHLYTDK